MSAEGPPHYGMPMPAHVFSKDSKKTFQHEDGLPSLQVPSLDDTLSKYLCSIRPHLSTDDYLRTMEIVNDFGKGIGQQLHFKLMEKAKYSRNWLEKWWEEYGYLRLRSPHPPYLNFVGISPYSREVWPKKDGSQIERAALVSWYKLKFWQILHKEVFQIDRVANGDVWSMFQYYRIFNGCKTPEESVDRLNHYFQTETEGPAPSDILVICRGRYFVFNVLDEDGHIITVPELELQLKHIRSLCEDRPDGPGLGALTVQDRAVWHQLRKHLISLHPENERNLLEIQKSIFVIVLDDSSPSSEEEVANESLLGNARMRWFDKTASEIFYQNGMTTTNFDHSPYDGLVNSVIGNFAFLALEACSYRWLGPKATRVLPVPKELHFQLDTKLLTAISDASQLFQQSRNLLETCVKNFTGFGKKLLTRHRFHPDAFVQMALQLGYYRLHQRCAPTYETATTRKYYHGRTETVRSCTTDSVDWTKSMLDDSFSDEVRLQLLRRACATHTKNMDQAKDGQGVDRHLLGLQIIAMENDISTPQLFLDKAWTKSGGGGNFILSTSCTGYTPIIGLTTPMCKHGYGFFYGIENERINVCVVSWSADKDTSSSSLYESVSDSLKIMRRLIETTAQPANL